MNKESLAEEYFKELKHHINMLIKVKLNNNLDSLKFINERINQMIEEVKK